MSPYVTVPHGRSILSDLKVYTLPVNYPIDYLDYTPMIKAVKHILSESTQIAAQFEKNKATTCQETSHSY